MDTAIHVGNEMHKDGVKSVADALVSIMSADADQTTIQEDIRAFSRLAEVKNVEVTDNQFVAGNVGPSDDQVRDWIMESVSAATKPILGRMMQDDDMRDLDSDTPPA